MGKPTDEEMEIALAEAARMREQGEDPHFLAKTLLNLNYRIKYLEDVMRAAELYTHSGMGSTEHLKLVSAIKTYHALDQRTAGMDQHPAGASEEKLII